MTRERGKTRHDQYTWLQQVPAPIDPRPSALHALPREERHDFLIPDPEETRPFCDGGSWVVNPLFSWCDLLLRPGNAEIRRHSSEYTPEDSDIVLIHQSLDRRCDTPTHTLCSLFECAMTSRDPLSRSARGLDGIDLMVRSSDWADMTADAALLHHAKSGWANGAARQMAQMLAEYCDPYFGSSEAIQALKSPSILPALLSARRLHRQAFSGKIGSVHDNFKLAEILADLDHYQDNSALQQSRLLRAASLASQAKWAGRRRPASPLSMAHSLRASANVLDQLLTTGQQRRTWSPLYTFYAELSSAGMLGDCTDGFVYVSEQSPYESASSCALYAPVYHLDVDSWVDVLGGPPEVRASRCRTALEYWQGEADGDALLGARRLVGTHLRAGSVLLARTAINAAVRGTNVPHVSSNVTRSFLSNAITGATGRAIPGRTVPAGIPPDTVLDGGLYASNSFVEKINDAAWRALLGHADMAGETTLRSIERALPLLMKESR